MGSGTRARAARRRESRDWISRTSPFGTSLVEVRVEKPHRLARVRGQLVPLTRLAPAIGEKAQAVLSSVLISREPRRHLHARFESKLVQDVVHMVVDRALRQVKAPGDLLVA